MGWVCFVEQFFNPEIIQYFFKRNPEIIDLNKCGKVKEETVGNETNIILKWKLSPSDFLERN